MSENNMSLLSQSEIDTLIDFLIKKQSDETISGDTLSQKSINKLINLVKSVPSLNKNITINTAAIEANALSFLANGEDKDSYELTYKLDENSQVQLFACNVDTKDLINISPCAIAHDNSPKTWGIFILPSIFDQIAKVLNISYSEETFNNLKELFAEKMYGDKSAIIPSFYLP